MTSSAAEAAHDPSRSVPPPVEHRRVDVQTSVGAARCYVVDARSPQVGTLVLGHGAGRGTNTPDLAGLTALSAHGWRVVLVDQPWVVQGRRLAVRPPVLDLAWLDVVAQLRSRGELDGRLVVGGRSAGARVACRTAGRVGADLVLALAFPLCPPGKKSSPQAWRTAEAAAVVSAGLPLVIVQGASDRYGTPGLVARTVPGARVLAVSGGHGFADDPVDVVAAVRGALA